MHPRCFNCHGGVSPALGTNHSGGIQTNDCYGCHNDAVDDNGRPLGAKGTWHLPPPEQFFVGKDAKMMCALMADFVMHMGKPHFIDHLMRDTLVVLGFIGQRGGAIGRRDPPPMTQAVFVDSAKVWLNEGMAACERVGTIIEKEKVLSDTTYPGPAPNSVNRVLRSGTRTATITLVNGRFHGTFIVAGQNVLQTIAHRTGRNGACTITSTITDTYDGNNSGGVLVRLSQVQPDSSYTIKVTGPAEKIHFVTTIHHTNDCDGGGPYPGDSDDAWRDEPGRTFTIEGHLRDPNDPRRIGGCTKTMSTLQSDPNDVQACFKRNEDQTPWFMDHYALAAKPDASLYPVTTTTTWNLLYRP